MPPPPAILLAFANDWGDERRHLRSLLEESKSISAALAPLVQSGSIALQTVPNATADEVMSTFRARSYRDRIRVFHFGGHASSSTLIFEDERGAPSVAHASGLASYLGKQQGLVLVFLNGCSTEAQVRRLRAAGSKQWSRPPHRSTTRLLRSSLRRSTPSSPLVRCATRSSPQ